MAKRSLSTYPAAMRLALARTAATQRMPYFTSLLLELVPRPTPGIKTMGVQPDGGLLYDPESEWLGALTPQQAATVLLHEGMHIYLRHATRFRRLVESGALADTHADRNLANIAADFEINDNLKAAGCEFPTTADGTVDGALPSKYQLPDHLSYEQYVEKLKEIRQQQSGDSSGMQAPWGPCGSGMGNPLEGEPELPPEGASGAGRTELDLAVACKSVSAAIQAEASRRRGSVPGGLLLHAEADLSPPKIPWRQKLARAARSALAYRPGAVDYTRNRSSRRYHAMRKVLGANAPIPYGMHSPIAEVLVIADTSGSMMCDIPAVLRETKGILKAMGGAEITFMASDAAVHALKRVRNLDEVKREMKGGLGTSFVPPFQAIAAGAVKPKPSLIVFITDGYGAYPGVDLQPSAPVIWVQVPSGRVTPNFGEVIAIDADEI